LLVANLACAEISDAHESPPSSIVVSGLGSASAMPDDAQIEIGVVTESAVAEQASQENAQRLDAVLKAVRAVLPKDTEIKTTQFSVQPNYQYPEAHAPKLIGYTVTNLIRIETADLAHVGQTIDQAMKAGANNVQSLQFKVKNEEGMRAEALRKAVADARSQAGVIAAAADVHILRILSVHAERTSPPVIYAERAMAMKSASVPTPIEQGSIELQATVTLTVEIGK
jgi:uncharacterized protein YggE